MIDNRYIDQDLITRFVEIAFCSHLQIETPLAWTDLDMRLAVSEIWPALGRAALARAVTCEESMDRDAGSAESNAVIASST